MQRFHGMVCPIWEIFWRISTSKRRRSEQIADLHPLHLNGGKIKRRTFKPAKKILELGKTTEKFE
uniref:Uncharacterized protein n=1 Tax=Romanomermis culicivorax TaxID=13658 RepID=A0A915HXX0_ROMCU